MSLWEHCAQRIRYSVWSTFVLLPWHRWINPILSFSVFRWCARGATSRTWVCSAMHCLSVFLHLGAHKIKHYTKCDTFFVSFESLISPPPLWCVYLCDAGAHKFWYSVWDTFAFLFISSLAQWVIVCKIKDKIPQTAQHFSPQLIKDKILSALISFSNSGFWYNATYHTHDATKRYSHRRFCHT